MLRRLHRYAYTRLVSERSVRRLDKRGELSYIGTPATTMLAFDTVSAVGNAPAGEEVVAVFWGGVLPIPIEEGLVRRSIHGEALDSIK